MKTKLVILLLVLLTVVNLTALATIAYQRYQAEQRFERYGPPGHPRHFLKKRLGLSEEQLLEFESQREKFMQDTAPLLEALDAKRKTLMDEIISDEPDLERIDTLIEETGALELALKKKTTMHLLENKSHLTPEQQKRLFSLFSGQRHPMRMMEHHEHEEGMGRGHGPHRERMEH